MKPKVLATCATPAIILLLLWPTLIGRDRLAFRDAGYFYTPLYGFVADQTAGQIWPGLNMGGIADRVWNDRENGGMSTAGETTTAVFYPVRHLVYALIPDAETALAWYVAIHLMIASATAGWLARRAGASDAAAVAASVIYPLSGSVLFLATNPPFLVGAAWWPAAFGSLVVRPSRPNDIWIAGGSTAAMVLGGDPQAAAHLAIVVAAVWGGRLILDRRNDPRPLFRGGIGLRPVAAAVLAIAISAPQLAESLAAAGRSVRTGDRPTPEAYAFSIAPWRHAEWVLPNVHGCPWPVNTRWDRPLWSGSVTPVDQLWTPTLYVGVLPLGLIAAAAWRGRRLKNAQPSMRLWVALAAAACLAAAGAYGPGYLVNQSIAGAGRLLGRNWDMAIPGATGGPVWLLRHLPGMSMFRYPAKWMPIATLGVAVATSIAIDRLRGRWPTPQPWGWAAIAIVGVMVAGSAKFWIPADWPTDIFWGPAQPAAAARGVGIATMHVALVLAIYAVIAGSGRRRWATAAVVALMAADLAVAHRHLVPRIDRDVEQTLLAEFNQSAASSILDQTYDAGGFEIRRYRFPERWQRTTAADRLVKVEAALRASGFGRWHLERPGPPVLHGFVSVQSRDAAAMLRDPASQPAGWGTVLPESWWYRPAVLLGLAGQLSLVAVPWLIAKSEN